MKKDIIIKIFKVAAGVFIAFVIVEVTLRFLGFPSINTNTFDKNNLVIFKPNQKFLSKDRCYSSVLRINDVGFHSRTYSVEKPYGTFRIVIIGDSFVEAVQVPLEKTFPAILEKKLNQNVNNVKYEVISIAKSGNGTLMNLMYAREYAIKLNPDLLINAFTTNDLEDDFTADKTMHAVSIGDIYDSDSFYLSPPTSGSRYALFLKHFLLERSLLFEKWWRNAVVIKSQFNKKSDLTVGGDEFKVDTFIEAQMEPQSKLAESMWAKEKKALNTFNQFAKSHQVRFMLVHLAEVYLVDKEELISRYHLSPEQVLALNSDMVRQKLKNVSLGGNFPFFSTKSFLLDNYKNTRNLSVFSCDNHYNELGHELTAEAIHEFLTDSSVKILK